jgi:transketolase
MAEAARMENENLEVEDFITRTPGVVQKLYGEALTNAAKSDPRIVALTADLSSPTETDIFRDAIPDRFFQLGIAEANMVGVAAGMARMGDIPFLHSFAVFATKRCYDQITMQIAYPRLPVKIMGFLPGISTMLGVSHQAIEDVALMRAMPNMAVLEPTGPQNFEAVVEETMAYDGPVYVRMKRPEQPFPANIVQEPLPFGKARVLSEGRDVAIIASGMTVACALEAARILGATGMSASVVESPWIKPLDSETMLRMARTHRAVVTAENHTIVGGLGSAVAELLAEAGIGVRFARIGLNDCFAEGGSTEFLFAKYGIDGKSIAARCQAILK